MPVAGAGATRHNAGLMIDLRSDTVTHPNRQMRRAMYDAELGDDVYGDDPTVNRLQEQSAALMGKEAGLFVASGTQGNLVSVLSHTVRGDEVLVGDQCHVFVNEAGGASVLGGVVLYPIATNRYGELAPELIAAAVKPHDYHRPRTRLLCVENTHNASSGRALDRARTAAMVAAARAAGLAVHLDGARLFNAAVALEVPAAELAADVDSVTFCLSKGLSCPVGSVVCGSREFIAEATRWRKMLGAGMRQVGVLAAAGLVALDTMIERLAEDHANARVLAHGLARFDAIDLEPDLIQTNIVRFEVAPGRGNEIAAELRRAGVLINPGTSELRMVTHYGITAQDVTATLEAMRAALATVGAEPVAAPVAG